MTVANDIISKLKLSRGMSMTVAIQNTREYLDSHPDSLKAANAITGKFGIQPINNKKKAYVFAMTAVEQSLNNMNPTIEAIIQKSNERITRITDMIGPHAFVDLDQQKSDTSSSPKGSKREVARAIYLEHKDKGDKRVIELVQEALGVTKQNAYTYVYLVKKDLTK
jgi:hypothetical protein